MQMNSGCLRRPLSSDAMHHNRPRDLSPKDRLFEDDVRHSVGFVYGESIRGKQVKVKCGGRNTSDEL
jgi:hypothetical protein